MLFKHSTQSAQDAIFTPRTDAYAGGAELQPEPPPTEDELAIVELTKSNEALRRELAVVRENWAHALSEAEMRARTHAAENHIRDDDKRIALLTAELSNARQRFEQSFLAAGGKVARELSAAAFGKLVAMRETDHDWLARNVAQRLAALDQGTVICLQAAPADLDGALSAILPRGTALEPDTALEPGTVRLQLRLGTVMIDPADGAARLLALLGEGEAHG